MPYIGNSPKNNVRDRYYYTATSGQTLFSGSDLNGKTLGYQDGRYVDVYLNGVILQDTTDYTATTKTSVTLVSGATTGDLVEIVAYGIFSVADTVSAASGGDFAGEVQFSGGIGGDVAFDTDTLKVVASSDRVGVNNASPDTTMKVNFSSASTAGFGINDTNSGNLGGMLQFYSGSSNGTLRANMMNANNAGIHIALGTSGTVVFGGTSYVAANALDEYEEGTFEPTLVNDGSSTYSTRQGHYTKIGNVVTIQTKTTINTRSGGSGTTGIMNLPYAMRSSSPSQQTFHLVGNNNWDTNYSDSNITGYASASGSTILFYYNSGLNLNGISVGDIGSSGEVYVSGSYLTD